ncbi:MAG: GGDEF domain-containing protein [Leptolyngbyaceae cyanobacterium SM2_5_2]|nr:GGDEF domain-containing protein [Leptolyngbyaceae cyanobacterium SM2_5_2]
MSKSLPLLDSQLDQPEKLQILKQRWLNILFTIALVVISGIWASEALIRHEVNPIDQVAYPTLLCSISMAIVLLRVRPQAYTWAVMGTVGVTVLYAVVFLQAIIWGYSPVRDNYNLSAFPQWYPLCYLAIFFSAEKQAAMASTVVYVSLVISSVLHGWLERDLPAQERIFPYLLHMIMSHPLYIGAFVVLATLQTSVAKAQAEARQADIDHLTNLANRRAATRTLTQALGQLSLGASTPGVMLIDVDRFKEINDGFGHGIGDQVLIQVAQLLQVGLSKTAMAARWGGEEFLIILAPTAHEELYQAAQQLRQQLAEAVHPTVGQVTASFGVALAEPGESLEGLMKRADDALYLAKQNGRNRVVLAPGLGQGHRIEPDLAQSPVR